MVTNYEEARFALWPRTQTVYHTLRNW